MSLRGTRPVIPAEWFTGRGVFVNGQVLSSADDAAEAGYDLSAAGRSVVFRAYGDGEDASADKSVTLTESAGTTGYFSGYIPAFADDAEGGYRAEIVLVDSATADANTPTGNKEIVLESTRIRVTRAGGT